MNVTGDFIAELRTEKGLSRIELAQELDVSYKIVELIENGAIELSDELINKLTNYFYITYDELFNGKRVLNRDGTVKASVVDKKKYMSRIKKFKLKLIMHGITAVAAAALGLWMVSKFQSIYFFWAALVITFAGIFIFIKNARKMSRIPDSSIVNNKEKLEFFSGIIRFIFIILCICVSVFAFAFSFSVFKGMVAEILIGIAIALLFCALMIYLMDRYLWEEKQKYSEKIVMVQENTAVFDDADKELKELELYEQLGMEGFLNDEAAIR